MNKLSIILVILLGLFIAMPAPSYAESSDNTILLEDMEGLSYDTRNEIIKNKLKKFKAAKKSTESVVEVVKNIEPSDVEAWASLISTTIKTVCNDLAIGVNEFAKTDVGKITMVLIVYKVIGEDIKGIIFGALLWIVSMPLIVMSFIHFHTRRKMKILDKDGKVTDIKYINRYVWDSDDAKTGSAVAHAVFFAALTFICVGIVC